jgi:hypothetical protein
MTGEYWATEELPGWAWDDEPPDEDDEPGIETVQPLEEYL